VIYLNKNYVSLHTHTTYSIMDSTSDPEDMIKMAVGFGMKAIAFTEHNNIYSHVKKKQLCDKYGIKYIHGIELAMTESLEEKIRDNYHVVLLAKNIDGVREINELYSKATDLEHSYYVPRMTFDEFLSTSNNIIRSSACLGGVLNKLDKSHPRYKELLDKFDYLEIQPHTHPAQKTYNEYLMTLGKPLLATGDFHEISSYKSECRLKWMHGKGKKYDDEDKFDLIFKNYGDFVYSFKKLSYIPEEIYLEAIDNTNVVADMVEDFELDFSFKFPTLYPNQEETLRKQTFDNLERMLDSNIIDSEKFDEYLERVDIELEAFRVLKMESFILFMAELMTWCRNNDVAVGQARGSASGSLVCYLTNVTDVDPIVWGTNFTRFINVNRISLPDYM